MVRHRLGSAEAPRGVTIARLSTVPPYYSKLGTDGVSWDPTNMYPSVPRHQAASVRMWDIEVQAPKTSGDGYRVIRRKVPGHSLQLLPTQM
jgi:hypothetical protein